MKNKSILAIMPATAIGFVNAGIFDDIALNPSILLF
jgi:hypothetical protein